MENPKIKNKAAQEMARLSHAAQWNNATPEKRKAAGKRLAAARWGSGKRSRRPPAIMAEIERK